MNPSLDIVFLGLSITSSWGNGHATTYRGLVKALREKGHRVLFLERDVPWYASHRDVELVSQKYVKLYGSLEELKDRFTRAVRKADLVLVGSYVPEGIEAGEWVLNTVQGVTGFYDIDTPITIARLQDNACEYLTPELASRYDLYLSFAGGASLRRLEEMLGSPLVRPLYCSVDPDLYFPEERERLFDLGYMGTYSEDRQPALEELLLAPAKKWPRGRFAVAGPQYPGDIQWPSSVHRIEHLAPPRHRWFYNEQRFTLNITRADMIAAGHSPSVRLFEAAACGVPVISDSWPGLEDFFTPGKELFVASSSSEALRLLREMPEGERRKVAEQARLRVLADHTASRRAEQLHAYFGQCLSRSASSCSPRAGGENKRDSSERGRRRHPAIP